MGLLGPRVYKPATEFDLSHTTVASVIESEVTGLGKRRQLGHKRYHGTDRVVSLVRVSSEGSEGTVLSLLGTSRGGGVPAAT